MKTLADLKRRLKVGMSLNLIYCRNRWDAVAQPLIEQKKFIRKIGKVDSVGFACESHKHPGQLSYCQWPKASGLKIENDTTFSLVESDGTVSLTYEIVTNGIE